MKSIKIFSRKIGFVVLACAMTAFASSMASASDEALVSRGREVFKLCAGCHSTIPNQHLFGPSLAGVVNRPAGRLKGYEFSDSLKAAKFRWDEKNLTRWLEDEPKNFVAGTRMEFPGITDKGDIRALVEFLRTQK